MKIIAKLYISDLDEEEDIWPFDYHPVLKDPEIIDILMNLIF
jgi:hypothetical protein